MSRPKHPKAKSNRPKKNEFWIWGHHSLEACLECRPELVAEVYLTESEDKVRFDKFTQNIVNLAQESGVKIRFVNKLPGAVTERRHQGMAAKLSASPLQDWSKIDDCNFGAASQFLLLDRVQDARNYGAILRSAAAFGVAGVFVGTREQADFSGVVAQASAGGCFRLPIIQTPRLDGVFDFFSDPKLKAQVWGLAGGGEPLAELLESPADLTGPLLWALGSEGEGLKKKWLERCGALVSIEMSEGVESLNVSTAAAVALYAGRAKLTSRLS